MELKKPSTGLEDAKFQSDAIGKAQHAKAPYIVLWNMRKADLYRTPQYPRASFDGEDFVRHLGECCSITSVDKGSTPSGQAELKRLALDVVLAVHDAMTKGSVGGQGDMLKRFSYVSQGTEMDGVVRNGGTKIR